MRSVLVTGATGFFGREFIYNLLNSDLCDRICVYSRNEAAQAELRSQIIGYMPEHRVRFFIGDVRDKDRLRRAMDGVDTVVHAAALKRIEVGHYNPTEMVKTNVLGSMNVIDCAQDSGVKVALLVSTDKAWNPISAYGHSKAMAESLFFAANNTVRTDGPRFVVTRYGNVFESTGSVVPVWRKLLQSPLNPIPITDPECTRFFMTVGESLKLVLDAIEAAEAGRDGWNSLVIPTLPAYRLGDLAEAMDIPESRLKIIGLPKWEKLHEGMSDGNTSDIARRMSVEELRNKLNPV